ncbi:DarT ssDNA thymidine ADP-ribosyltransferase family protein [Leclercia sp.]|uniref:DarT ssDNA thymidine ADP-ribosyltransferase family protein n=1 Tax=Leclercia sp. TaxID=1898428 RepID=UPI002FDE0B84
MWTAIGIFFVLAVIGNILNKKKANPPSSKPKPSLSSKNTLPNHDAHRRTAARTLITDLPAPPSASLPVTSDNLSLSLHDARTLLSQVEGFRDFLLTRYAITGLTHLSPAYTSDLHHAFMREVGPLHFYALQHFDWRSVVDFTPVKRKPVPALYHFTHLSNLESILEHGILTRQQLDASGHPFRYNDTRRLDGIRNSISLSIGHVNNKMLFKYTQGLQDHDWVILKIKPDLIAGPSAPSFDHAHLLQNNVFCRNNAASAEMTAISVAARQTWHAFHQLFADEQGQDRGERPYDVQAEVLHLATIPTHFISEIIFYAAENVPAWLSPAKANIVVDPARFSFR